MMSLDTHAGARPAGPVRAAPGESHASAPTRARSEHLATSCTAGESVLGYLGVTRAGEAIAARQSLGSALLAEVTDSSTGQVVDLARSPNGMNAPALSGLFSQWSPVYPQSQQSQMQSCDLLLSDRPAAQPIIDAAEASLARAGFFKSAADVSSQLQQVLVSDDPARPGYVIVTLIFLGAPYTPAAPQGAQMGSHPQLYSSSDCTAIENQADDQVTGVAKGGLLSVRPNHLSPVPV